MTYKINIFLLQHPLKTWYFFLTDLFNFESEVCHIADIRIIVRPNLYFMQMFNM